MSINSLNAQENSFYHYGIEQGLSQQTIRCILKDSKGFLWLGTQDGLNRFDGTSFTVYKNQKKDTLTISGNFINTLIEDDDGNIWIGTNDNGISIYDSNLNSFKSTTIKKGNCSNLSRTSDGSIIATVLNEGITIFKKKGKNYVPKEISRINNEGLQFNTTFVNKNNELYLSTEDGRLFVSKDYMEVDASFREIAFNFPIGTINTLYIDEENIWLGTTSGLFVFSTTTQLLSEIKLESNQGFDEKLNVTSIDVNKNTFYIGTFNGLFITEDFNKNQLRFEKIKTFKGEQEQINAITSNRVYDTFTDGHLLWVGTNNLDVITLKEAVFKNINTFSNVALNNAFILSFAKHRNFLFIGTRKGINCINANGDVTYITKENTNQELAFNVIRSMTIDHDNNLWIGTLKGVSIIDLDNFDPKSPNIISIYNNLSNPKSLSSDATRGVFVDHRGSIWIMTYGGGINRFTGDIKNNIITFESYKANPETNALSSNFTYNMSQDKDLNYWITSEDGLNKLQFTAPNYQDPKFEKYYSNTNDTTSLSSNTTLHTWHDANGTLWVATQDGFNRFNSEDQTFKRYGIEEGLTNTFVYSITEDLENKLWLTTNGGLFRFNKKTEVFTNYNQGDGLQSSEFNLGAHYFDKTLNDIYIGGVSGVNVFKPNKVSELDIPGNLTFTSLKIKDKEINSITNPNVIKESITITDEITLHQNDFPCYISFSDLDLRPNKNNQFIYSLDNYEWNELRDSREIQLLSLPKGSHLLQIQGKSRDILWDKSPLQLKIKVIPPWYNSNLAYLIYLLLFLGIVYAFYRISLQRQIVVQESKRLQDLDDLRSRFITNITHEFRTPLTIILGYLGNVKANLSYKDKVTTSLNTIEQNSNNLLDLVNQMLDLAKLEKGQLNVSYIQDDIVKFTSSVIDSFMSIASDKDIIVKLNATPKTITMDFDAEKMRQILTNLIANALKFSPVNSELTITLNELETQSLHLEIRDQGHGIPEEELPFIFDRFYQVENAEHKISQGTGIGLALTRELLELLNGNIEVSSTVGSGTTFSIRLPITNTAEKKELHTSNNQITIGTVVPQMDDVITNEDANSVLIVEDNGDMARYIASCLKPDYKVSFAKNGKEGLEIAEKNIPDIVVTDVMMPVMDGFELTQKLQTNSSTNHIPIIMLTSKAMQEDKMEGIISGADAYLTKPFEKNELLLRMHKLIEKRKQLQERYSVNSVVDQNVNHPKTTDKKLVFLNSVIDAIHQHLDNSDFGATELANYLNMSDSQLYRKLKAISNTSTSIFIRKVRLEKGKELLKSSDLSISEIAFTTGFNDPNWFSKVFKEEFKQSPSEFRK